MSDDALELYFEPKTPHSFGSVRTLSKRTKRGEKDIREWLMDKDAYTLHKPINSNFRRRKTYTKYVNDLWQADVADVSSIASHNDNYRYLLCNIDCFPRRANVIAMKNKT